MYHIIVNPASRSGRGLKIWQKAIEPALSEGNIEYKVYFSEKAGDISVLSEMITDKASAASPVRLIILGGDGTFNEAIQAMKNMEHVTIGYIPTGSSNDLARDMKISKDPIAALKRILSGGNITEMDMGIMTTPSKTRYFSVSCGIGFDAAVCEEAMSSPIKDTLNRLGLGKLTYLGIALKQLFTTKPVCCDIRLDNGETIHVERILFAAAMTHRFEGGGFKFCPTAVCDDGFCDLCVVGSLPKLVLLLALPTAFFGKHYLFPGINHYRAREIQIHTSVPLWVHTDGEVSFRTDDIHVTYDKRKISFLS